MTATTAYNKAETKLDEAEMNYIQDDSAANKAKLTAAIDLMKLKSAELQNRKDILSSKEVALDVVLANNDVSASSIQNDLDAYVSASSANDRAGEILALSQNLTKRNRGVEPGNKTVLFYTQVGEDATDNYGEPLQFNDTSEWKTTFDIFQELWAKETEKMQPLRTLDTALEAAISKEMSKEKKLKVSIGAAVGKVLKEYEVDDKIDFKLIFETLIPDMKKLIETEAEIKLAKLVDALVDAMIQIAYNNAVTNLKDMLPKILKRYMAQEVAKDRMAYKAIVLTAMTSDDEEIVNQYRLKHSGYSHKSIALWGVVD